MDGQLSLLDMPQAKPDYQGCMDEIRRYSIEVEFERRIKLQRCSACGENPKEYFRSCYEYFVKCPFCGRRTAYYRHSYEAKQAWNRGEIRKSYVERRTANDNL